MKEAALSLMHEILCCAMLRTLLCKDTRPNRGKQDPHRQLSHEFPIDCQEVWAPSLGAVLETVADASRDGAGGYLSKAEIV